MVTKLPFTKVVQEFADKLEMPTLQYHQQAKDQDSIADCGTLEDLMEEVNHLRTVQEKVIYAVKQGKDAHSKAVLEKIVADHPEAQLQRVSDKQLANCSLMHICAMKNKVQCMDWLLGHKLTIDCVDSIDATPLLYAVSQNCEDAVVYLLGKGANVNRKDMYNKSALLISLKNKYYKIVDHLVMFNCNANIRGTKGATALHYLAQEGDLEGVRYLVEKCQASPQRRDNDEDNVLCYALPHPDVCYYLANKFSDKGLNKMVLNENGYSRNLIHEAAMTKKLDSVLHILRAARLNEMSTSQVNKLLNAPDKGGDVPLILAVKNNDVDMVKFLCSCQETKLNVPDDNGVTALSHAMTLKDKTIITTLSNAGASTKPESQDQNMNCNQVHPLIDCARSLNTLLIIILAVIAIVCIICVAGMYIHYYYLLYNNSNQFVTNSNFIIILWINSE
jgi:ankyrin repeat protein